MNNILILSCGTRNKIIQYFKQALTDSLGNRTGLVVATDMSCIAPALYEADKHYIVPRMTSDGYIDIIFDICKNEKIKAVLSLIDPELSLIAKFSSDFESIGVKVIGSSFELCEMCLNKMSMYNWLTTHNYKTARSYTNIECFYNDLHNNVIDFPVFVKPIYGSASNLINKVYDIDFLELLFKYNDNLMIQEFLDGQEIGADVYIDFISGDVVSIFTKKKLLMKAGETDKAISFKNERLFDLITDFVNEAGFKGQIDIDIFEINGQFYISEVNPRFGGGYPHAYECGCNHMSMIVNNMNKIANKCEIGNYKSDLIMMKYIDVLIKSNTETKN